MLRAFRRNQLTSALCQNEVTHFRIGGEKMVVGWKGHWLVVIAGRCLGVSMGFCWV